MKEFKNKTVSAAVFVLNVMCSWASQGLVKCLTRVSDLDFIRIIVYNV